MDNRNIIDHYKYWKTEAIKAELDVKRHDFSVLITNHFSDFNLGTVIRNCNAFLAKEIVILGRRAWDKRGAVGTNHYEKIKLLKTIEELNFNCPVIGIDNIEGAEPIDDFVWPSGNFIMAFGQEDVGLIKEVLDVCNKIVYIRQYGSVRSLNVGCASAIAMQDYVVKHHRKLLD